MQLGMVGLGRMGANMVRRLMGGGHACVAYDLSAEAVDAVGREGATGAASLDDFVNRLDRPRTICLMLPAAVVDWTLDALIPSCTRTTSSSTVVIRTTTTTSPAPRGSSRTASTTWTWARAAAYGASSAATA